MPKQRRGLACLDKAKVREISSKGGKAAHAKGAAHEWTHLTAKEAGRKGGISTGKVRRRQREAELVAGQ